MSYRSVENQLLEAELMGCTPEHVYAWLKTRAATVDAYAAEGDEELEEGDEELEDALLRRSSPLIDLGLARYGFSIKVVKRLFVLASQPPSQTRPPNVWNRFETPIIGKSEQIVIG